ncbi:F-box domain, partial [Arabidopsis suecica]
NHKTMIISEDIVEEIFQHLPIKSLSRFKVLSKKWRTMIESTYFSHKRLLRTGLPTPNMKFLHVSQHFSANFVEEDSNSTTLLLGNFSRDDHNSGKKCPSSSSYYSFPGDPIDDSQKKTIQVLGSCDGLVLIRIHDDFRYIYLINPTTKEHMTLYPEFTQWPLPLSYSIPANRSWRQLTQSAVLDYPPAGELVKKMPFLAGFGKDIVTKSYKVVLIYTRKGNYDHCFKVKVLSLDNGEQRDVGFYSINNCIFCKEQTSVYANGSLFWLTLNKHRQTLSMLLAIDIHTEEFRWILLPECYINYATRIEMWNLNDRLCLSDVLECSNLVIWSLQQEYPTEKWEKIYSIDFIRTNQLHEKFWMLGLGAAYFSSIRNHRDKISFFRQRTISYSPTMISPSSLML